MDRQVENAKLIWHNEIQAIIDVRVNSYENIIEYHLVLDICKDNHTLNRRPQMRKTTLMCLLILLAVSSAVSQDYKGKGRINGTVVDQDGSPIPGVQIKLYSQKASKGFEVQTDEKGNWKAAWIRGGDWDIDFELVPYIPKKITVSVNEHSRNKPIDIVLEKPEKLAVTDTLKESVVEGNRLFDEEKYQESISVFEGILDKQPDAYILHMNIGNSYFHMEDFSKAEEHYRFVLGKEPDNVNAIIALASCYVNLDENEKAEALYQQLDITQINDSTVLYNIGASYYITSNFQEAEKYFRKAVSVQPDFLDGYYQLGLTLLNLGNNTEAIVAFEKYLEIDSDSAQAAQVKGFLEHLKK